MIQMHAVNENTWIVYLGDEISESVLARVSRLTESIRASLGDSVHDIIPSYTSILVSFNLQKMDRFSMAAGLRRAVEQASSMQWVDAEPDEVVLPVYYGPEVALDMEHITRSCGMDAAEVIRLHCEQVYRVYAIGFSPGFAYLGNTPEPLRIARKATPRLKVPAGSLAIADNQTAIYPAQTPGGWQIIGRTPLQLVDWDSATLTRVKVGDRVRFEPIDRDRFIALGGSLNEF